VIITEEDDYEEDDEDIDDDEDEEEQFKNLDKTDPLSLRTHAHPPDARGAIHQNLRIILNSDS
jgi:hypothetical protein